MASKSKKERRLVDGQSAIREEKRRSRRDPAPAAFLHDQLGKMEEAVVLTGVRMKDVGDPRRGVFPKGAQPKPLLAFNGMSLPVPLRREIRLDRGRRSINLLRHEGR